MIQAQSQLSLGDYMLREGQITQSQFNHALKEQRKSSRSIGRILVDTELITESMRMTILQKQFGFKLIHLPEQEIDQLILALIPFAFADKHKIVPIRQEPDRALVVAMEDPTDTLVIDMIENQLEMNVKPFISSNEDIAKVLSQYGIQEQLPAVNLEMNLKDRPWYRFLRKYTLPMMVFLPLAIFFAAIQFNWKEFGDFLSRSYSEGIISGFDFFLYLLLLWSLWSIILYWLNGIVFNTGKPGEKI